MKRSEMLEKIEFLLKDADPDNLSNEDIKIVAEKVLFVCEKAGMLPPGRTRSPGDNDWNENFLPYSFQDNSWEKE